MATIKINNNVFLPMPVVLVGANVQNKPNFMAVAWITRANYNPPQVAVAINKSHYTYPGIRENKTFSVCYPSADLMVKTDYCGIVSGKKEDKSDLFEVFYGETKTAPMIKECPMNCECRVIQEVDLPADTLFIGEIVSAYAEEQFLNNGKPDIKKMDLFILTMPDNTYWRIGNKLGDAWKSGKELKK